VYLSSAAAAAQNVAESQAEVSRTTADVEQGGSTDMVEAPAVKVEVSAELTAAAPGPRLLSPPAGDKRLPTANGPTSRVVTGSRLSRTLDLSTPGAARVDTTDSKAPSSESTTLTLSNEAAAQPATATGVTSNLSHTVRCDYTPYTSCPKLAITLASSTQSVVHGFQQNVKHRTILLLFTATLL